MLVVDVLVVVVKLVVVVPVIVKSIEFKQVPLDFTRITVAALGTKDELYPATNDAVLIPISNGVTNPSTSE